MIGLRGRNNRLHLIKKNSFIFINWKFSVFLVNFLDFWKNIFVIISPKRKPPNKHFHVHSPPSWSFSYFSFILFSGCLTFGNLDIWRLWYPIRNYPINNLFFFYIFRWKNSVSIIQSDMRSLTLFLESKEIENPDIVSLFIF